MKNNGAKTTGNFVNNICKNLKEQSPVILAGFAISGVIFTAVEASKAGVKAKEKLEKARNEKGEDLTKVEKVKTAAPCFVKTAVVGAATIGCVVGTTSASLKKTSGFAGLYVAARKELEQIEKKTEELCGEEKAKEIHDAVVDEKMKEVTAVEKKPGSKEYTYYDPGLDEAVSVKTYHYAEETGHGDVLFFDAFSGRYFRCDKEWIRKCCNDINYSMRSDMYTDLNELHYAIGLKQTVAGEMNGWNIDRPIDPEFRPGSSPWDEPCWILDYRVRPSADFRYPYSVV